MKKSLLIALIIHISCIIVGQNYQVQYTFDAAGNRTSRTIVIISLKSAQANSIVKADTISQKPIEESWGKKNVSIYPNPTKANLVISISGGDTNVNYTYVLYNSSGAQISSGSISQSENYTLQMEQYNTGIYILLLQYNNDRIPFKIIKE